MAAGVTASNGLASRRFPTGAAIGDRWRLRAGCEPKRVIAQAVFRPAGLSRAVERAILHTHGPLACPGARSPCPTVMQEYRYDALSDCAYGWLQELSGRVDVPDEHSGALR